MRRREHERIVHEYQREIQHLRRHNDELLDKLLYVTGSPWTPPPQPDVPEDEGPPAEWQWNPEQTLDAVEVDA